MNKIYLDNAATSPVSQSAKAAVLSSLDNFANPSAQHGMGIDAEKNLQKAREIIARSISAKPAEIIFTSGGTEANNTAILGTAKLRGSTAVATTKAEHPSVLQPFEKLAENGFMLKYINLLNPSGIVDMQSLKEILSADTPVALLSVHHIQNETGIIQDIAAIGKMIKQISPGTLFHVDTVQSFCKIPINVNTMHIDLLSVSAHKIGGLKGIGALFIRKGVHLRPIILGAGQETGLRAGTENTPGIAAFAAAVNEHHPAIADNYKYASALKERFLLNINKLEGIDINGENTSPYILNISVKGIRPEVLLNALSAEGVYISAGSACSSSKAQKRKESLAFKAYGLPKERAETALRISFSVNNTIEEIDTAADVFVKNADKLRSVRRIK